MQNLRLHYYPKRVQLTEEGSTVALTNAVFFPGVRHYVLPSGIKYPSCLFAPEREKISRKQAHGRCSMKSCLHHFYVVSAAQEERIFTFVEIKEIDDTDSRVCSNEYKKVSIPLRFLLFVLFVFPCCCNFVW